LNENLGSWLFLGVILTSLELEPSVEPGGALPPDLCGNCRQCLDACPTDALIEPYVLDARRCVSYLTIELRGSIPEQFREPMGWQIYGCDICQDVCPYNRRAPASKVPQFEPRPFPKGESLYRPSLERIAEMSEEEFREAFRGSAVKRAKWAGMVRNACVALGNALSRLDAVERRRASELLKRLAGSTVPTIAESAQWALSRIQ
jgi:epoxyqueuosine reductase